MGITMKKTILIAMASLLLGLSACSVEKSTTEKTVNQATNTNSMTIDAKIKTYLQENDDTTEKYQVSDVKLTKGKQTYFVNVESEMLCGTGGCPLLIIVKNSDNTFAIINDFSPIQDITISDEVKNNWKVLNVLIGDGGSSEMQRYIYDKKSKMYQLVNVQ